MILPGHNNFNVQISPQIFVTPSLLGRAHSSAKLQRESLRKPAERSSGFVLRGSCDPKQRKKKKVKKRHHFWLTGFDWIMFWFKKIIILSNDKEVR